MIFGHTPFFLLIFFAICKMLSASLAEAVVVEPKEATAHYNLACYLSLTGEKARTLAHLAEALLLDPTYRKLVDDEPDFDPIRADAQFQAITSIIV